MDCRLLVQAMQYMHGGYCAKYLVVNGETRDKFVPKYEVEMITKEEFELFSLLLKIH